MVHGVQPACPELGSNSSKGATPITVITSLTVSTNIACRKRSGPRRSGIAAASRRHTPSLRPAWRSSDKPASEDWVPPLKSTLNFLRSTTGRSNRERPIVGHVTSACSPKPTVKPHGPLASDQLDHP
jgi:hypothetical protein